MKSASRTGNAYAAILAGGSERAWAILTSQAVSHVGLEADSSCTPSRILRVGGVRCCASPMP